MFRYYAIISFFLTIKYYLILKYLINSWQVADKKIRHIPFKMQIITFIVSKLYKQYNEHQFIKDTLPVSYRSGFFYIRHINHIKAVKLTPVNMRNCQIYLSMHVKYYRKKNELFEIVWPANSAMFIYILTHCVETVKFLDYNHHFKLTRWCKGNAYALGEEGPGFNSRHRQRILCSILFVLSLLCFYFFVQKQNNCNTFLNFFSNVWLNRYKGCDSPWFCGGCICSPIDLPPRTIHTPYNWYPGHSFPYLTYRYKIYCLMSFDWRAKHLRSSFLFTTFVSPKTNHLGP